MTALQAIFQEARDRPDRTAVVYDGHPLTYGYFARCIAATRDWLAGEIGAGPHPGQTAVVCVHSLLEAWVFDLALRSLGLDTVTVRSAQDISGLHLPAVRCLITSEAEAHGTLAKAAAELGRPLLAAPASVGEAARSAGAAPEPPSPAPAGGHILLTSGTTGTFKKILIDSASETANASRRAELYGLDASSAVSLFNFGGWTSAGHNIAACAWSARAAVVIQQSGRPHQALAYPGLTHAVLTPAILGDVLSAADAPRREGLRLIVISGALSRAAFEQARARITSKVYTNLGATETGPFSMTLIEDPAELRWHQVHPSREAQVVDDEDRPVPPGVLGFLRIRIVDSVTGYLGEPRTTAAFFRDGWFYPGDLAQVREDGRIALFGRVTDVINIQGSKHPTAPIEAALQDALGVEGVCVFSTQNPGAEEEVHVAFEAAAPIDPALLAPALSTALHGFERAHVHYLPSLPRNTTGKVVRGELRALLATGALPQD